MRALRRAELISPYRIQRNPIARDVLAVLLRQTQWTLDDVAHDLPAGQVTPQQREELAAIMPTSPAQAF